MGHLGMEEEGARGGSVGEQIGGGKAVLKQGVDWLAELCRLAHWQKWPVEPNHQDFPLKLHILNLRIQGLKREQLASIFLK